MTGIVLAGGKATRMGGRNKAFLKIGDEPIISRQLKILRKIFEEIIIVANSVNDYTGLQEVKIISDTLPALGPIGGIYSGLIASSAFHNFVFACDMPFLNESAIKYMVENREGYDAVVPRIYRRYHPLFGIYSKNCILVMEELIKLGDFRVSSIYPKVKVRFVSGYEMERFDKNLAFLTNVNTKEDYETCLTAR